MKPRTDILFLLMFSPADIARKAIRLVHDPEKWKPVFGRDHALRKTMAVTLR